MTRSETIGKLAEALAALGGIWAQVSKHPTLWVSVDGRVVSTSPRFRLLKGSTSGRYRSVMVYVPEAGRFRHRYVHRLVCETFNGPCPAGFECRHLDGNRFNNTAWNLAWGTHLDNESDKIAQGLTLAGERNPRARLSRDIVSVMREVRRTQPALSYKRIAEQFGISTMAAYRAVVGHSWK